MNILCDYSNILRHLASKISFTYRDERLSPEHSLVLDSTNVMYRIDIIKENMHNGGRMCCVFERTIKRYLNRMYQKLNKRKPRETENCQIVLIGCK